MTKRSLNQKRTRFTRNSAGSAASKFGQMIGSAFETVVLDAIEAYLQSHHPAYEIVQAGVLSALDMFGGKSRQVDNVITPVDSDDPVALLETKWLKDGRHHNDKGAWILQLREIRKRYATIRGTAAVLIGFWTGDVVIFLMNEGQVEAVLVASDEQVYETMQPHLDRHLSLNELDPLILDAQQIRNKYARAWDLANFIQWLDGEGKLLPLADSWLQLVHPSQPGVTGEQKLWQALDTFLDPLPDAPRIAQWEITLQTETGNLIHRKFDDFEEMQDFLLNRTTPEEIRRQITPKKRPKP